jgi:general secretion pathway protein B
MSLILEALKKSEQQRRLGEAPTLGSPVVATRRRRSLLPILAILVLAAAGVAWWLMRPHASTQPAPPPTVAAERANPAAPIAAARAPPTTVPNNRAQDRAKAAADSARPNAQRVEQEKRVAGLGNTAARAAPATAAPALKGIPPTAPSTAAPPVVQKPGGAGAPGSQPATSPDATVAKTPPAPPSTAKADAPAAPTAGKSGANDSALPSVWDLPFATRKELPAIDLSMHVYSADPKQRFVVIKGDRHVEGDEVGTDLILREIRQDGLVLDYKGQRFFFPRSGR